MLKGFRDFVLRGNVLDLAVAVVIGAAFGAIIKSFTDDVLMQFIAAIVKKPDFSSVVLNLHGTPIKVGNFLNALISFLLIASAVYFFVVLPVNTLMARMKLNAPPPDPPATKPCPECLSDIPVAATRCAHCGQPVPAAA